MRELLLCRCFGLSNSDVGVAVVVGVVVAWSSSVTDVAFGSTSGSCCRVCDAPSWMLCRVGHGSRLGRLLGGLFATTATSLELAPLCCLVEGPISHFLAVSLCLLLGFQPPSLWFVTSTGGLSSAALCSPFFWPFSS
jgi:type IV secretory pathway VirB2 component (pilin)